MVQNKKTMKSFKNKTRIENPKELWIVVENTHEAIIDCDTWETVQEKLKSNKKKRARKTNTGDISLFSDIIFCKDCKSKLTFNSREYITMTSYFYRCSKYIQHGKNACTPHNINIEIIKSAVLEDIKKYATLAKKDEEKFICKLYKFSRDNLKKEIQHYKDSEKKISERISEIDTLTVKAFEKNCNDIIDDDIFK